MDWTVLLFGLTRGTGGLLHLLRQRSFKKPHGLSFKVRFFLLNTAVILSVGCQRSSPPESPPPPKTVETKVVFLAVGDIMLSRGVARVMDRANDQIGRAHV